MTFCIYFSYYPCPMKFSHCYVISGIKGLEVENFNHISFLKSIVEEKMLKMVYLTIFNIQNLGKWPLQGDIRLALKTIYSIYLKNDN